MRPWAAKTSNRRRATSGRRPTPRSSSCLLRLQANYLWPAMHAGTPAFNFYPANKELADEYGIVMGSSHCEQMLRNNVDEWKRDGHGEYNYVTNRDGVLKYWEQRVRENGKFENIYTAGHAGHPRLRHAGRRHATGAGRAAAPHHRGPTGAAAPMGEPGRDEGAADLLSLQGSARALPPARRRSGRTSRSSGRTTIAATSASSPNEQERQRSGGAGVYYHISYWGQPYDYLWLCSTPPALVWEEMTKAWDYGARTLWVINVGDLKPAEIGMEFSLLLAWNPHQWNAGNVNVFLVDVATRDFGPHHAKEIAAILSEYFRLNLQRKPEHMGFDERNPLLAKPVFSVTVNGDEAQQRLEAFRDLATRADAVAKKLPPATQDARSIARWMKQQYRSDFPTKVGAIPEERLDLRWQVMGPYIRRIAHDHVEAPTPTLPSPCQGEGWGEGLMLVGELFPPIEGVLVAPGGAKGGFQLGG